MSDTAKVIRLEPEMQRHVRGRLARLPAAAHALHERGKTLLAVRLEAFFDAADDALFDMADKASSNQEQNLFFDSMREVRVQRKGVEKRFFEGVDEAFASLVEADKRDTLMPDGELTADALSLVQNDDLEQMVALESTANRANRAYQVNIERLSYGMKSLVPTTVTAKNNPFGPELLCTAFMGQIKRLDIDIKAKLVLFKLFDRVLISELPAIYKTLETLLLQHGLDVHTTAPTRTAPGAPVSQSPDLSQHISPAETVSLNRSASATYGGEEGGGMPSMSEVDVGAANAIRPSGGAGSSSNANGYAGSRGAAGGQHQLMELLSFVQKLPAIATSTKTYSIEHVLERVQKHKGQSISLGAVEHETIRLVEMLFDFILRDGTLDAPIKQLLCRLQIPVLKVALMDKQFLSDKGHAARRLLNEMALQAVGWQSDGSQAAMEEPLAKCLQKIVERIVADFDQDVDVFQDALTEFKAFIEKDRRRSSVLEKRMVDAEDGKARAEQARAKVGAEVSARADRHPLPAVVNNLINGPLSNVMFVTGLKHGFESTHWKEQIALLEDIIWSVLPSVDTQKLMRKGPNIIQRLRSAMDTVSYNPFEVSELLLGLEAIHVARIRKESDEVVPASKIPESEVRGSGVAGSKAGPVASAAASSKPSTQRASEAVKQTEVESAAAPRAAPVGRDTNSPNDTSQNDILPADDPHMLTVAAFTQGSWYDFQAQEGKPLRCRLAAYIKPTGKYIFVTRAGMKAAEKSQQELAIAMKKGFLRPVDNSMLFDRALENIVTGMRNNKPASPLEDMRKKEEH